MKKETKIKFAVSSVAVAFLLISPLATRLVFAQGENRTEPSDNRVSDDPIRELNLTPEQRQQIRAIRQENQEERTSINRRLREANQSLQEALDVDNPDEATLEPLLRQIGMLQAEQMRLRVLSEVRIRRVLTPEQQELLRNLRAVRRLRRQTNPREGLRRFPNQRNTFRQVVPRNRP
jgi:Spy/CpxP family protein refolding chaperone